MSDSLKDDVLAKLGSLEERLRKLRAAVRALRVKTVGRAALRNEADALADYWVEEIRSHLEHDFVIPADVIGKYAEQFKRLHVISRPSNLASSYVDCLNRLLKDFKDDLVLPIKQTTEPVAQNATLRAIVRKLPEGDVSTYLAEAISCAEVGSSRGAIVLAWCAGIDRIQQKIEQIGFDKFSQATIEMKQATKGRFKDFKKEYAINTLSELQEIPDSDLLWVLEWLGLIDSNQSERLRGYLQYRKQSAHPGQAPIGEVHLSPFFSDLIDIVLSNPKFGTV